MAASEAQEPSQESLQILTRQERSLRQVQDLLEHRFKHA